MANTPEKTPAFEEGMEELEALVQALEKGELSLEESFKAYEKGVRLAAQLRSVLDQGEARIMALSEDLKKQDISGEVIAS